MEYNKKTGFVSLIGRPSSGKSTLINTICGYKISAVSDHPQTTQFIIRGIYNDEESQIIFVDTPGYHHFDSNLNRGLSNLAVRSLEEGDLILYLVDLTREFGKEEEDIISKIKKVKNIPVLVVYNKIDLKSKIKKDVKKIISEKLNNPEEVEISAKDNKNIKNLLTKVKKLLPMGPLYYSEDSVTDQSIPFRIKEIVKEKVFLNTSDEIPHATYVDVDHLDVKEDKIHCKAVIFVERESQKGIIVGKKGSMIKKIGAESRKELISIFERKVDLFLRVKVHYKWKRKEMFLKKKFNLQ